MLVGDVRWAITGAGSSWKLSGGRSCSCVVTWTSKYRHVRRATRRSASMSSRVAPISAELYGTQIFVATNGAATQNAATTPATSAAPPPPAMPAATTSAADTKPPHIRRT